MVKNKERNQQGFVISGTLIHSNIENFILSYLFTIESTQIVKYIFLIREYLVITIVT